MYYTINESAARTAKHMNSFGEYVEGSATASYRSQVDEAIRIGEEQKAKVDPEYHGKIDYYVDLYARKLAENLNHGYEIETRCPSLLISGGGNFPVAKKMKQNAARDKNMEEYNHVQGILDKIRSIGTGGIRSDDDNAIEKLEKKLAKLQEEQETMKKVNAYYRKHKTLDGCPDINPYVLPVLKASMEASWKTNKVPYESWALSNNNANIHRIKERIESLKKEQERQENGQKSETEHDGFILKENTAEMRIQFLFDGKPDEQTRSLLKSNGFKWSPKNSAWQRLLNENGRRAAEYVVKQLEGEI